MFSVFGIVAYLVNVGLVRPLDEHDGGPCRLQVGDNLHVLVHALRVRHHPSAHVLEGPRAVALVGVGLGVEPAEHEPAVVTHDERHHVIDVFAPHPAVDVPDPVVYRHGREGGEVLPVVGSVHVALAALHEALVGPCLRAGEYYVIGRDVPELVVGGKQGRCRYLGNLVVLLLRHEARGVPRPPLRLWHELECVVDVPRRPGVEYLPATVDEVLYLAVAVLGVLPLCPRTSVFEVHYVIREDDVVVLARERAADSHPRELCTASRVVG